MFGFKDRLSRRQPTLEHAGDALSRVVQNINGAGIKLDPEREAPYMPGVEKAVADALGVRLTDADPTGPEPGPEAPPAKNVIERFEDSYAKSMQTLEARQAWLRQRIERDSAELAQVELTIRSVGAARDVLAKKGSRTTLPQLEGPQAWPTPKRTQAPERLPSKSKAKPARSRAKPKPEPKAPAEADLVV